MVKGVPSKALLESLHGVVPYSMDVSLTSSTGHGCRTRVHVWLCAGSEREARLYGDLQAMDAAFWTEEDLRDRGFFKTPDARLRVCLRPAATSTAALCYLVPACHFVYWAAA